MKISKLLKKAKQLIENNNDGGCDEEAMLFLSKNSLKSHKSYDRWLKMLDYLWSARCALKIEYTPNNYEELIRIYNAAISIAIRDEMY